MDPTAICNLALDVLKEAPISSIDDDRPIALWCKRNFAVQRDGALAKANWNFAMKRQSIAADADAPEFGWDYAYTLPADCIRVVPLTYDGRSEGRPVAHEVEGGKVLTNLSGPLKVRFVRRTEDYAAYHPLFIDYLTARLARRMAHWLTGKSSYMQIADGLLKEAWQEAWLADAIEGDTPRPADDDWIDARY